MHNILAAFLFTTSRIDVIFDLIPLALADIITISLLVTPSSVLGLFFPALIPLALAFGLEALFFTEVLEFLDTLILLEILSFPDCSGQTLKFL